MADNPAKSKEKNKTSSIPKFLKYCAAALSVVSFLTTMQGVEDLIVKDSLKAGMISFAVQGIILVLGLYFLNVWNAINELVTKKFAVAVLRGLVVILYISSLAFSSFFSFVFITNTAYEGVDTTDYNMEIEQFLINSTNELEKINDENCDELLLTIRTQAPEFNNLLQQNKNNASDEIKSIKNGITKFDVATIKEEDKFTAVGARDAYKIANLGNASDERLSEIEDGCKDFESTMNTYVELYEKYYNDYLDLFENLNNQNDSSKIEIEINKIETLASTISDAQNRLSIATIVAYNSVKTYAIQKRDGISNYYSNLISELNKLKSAYDEIGNSETVKNVDNTELQSFYKSIYSSDIIDTDIIDSAETQLQSLLQTYLNDLQENEIESYSEKIESLSICISNLNSLKKGLILQEKISEFKSNQLKNVYIIKNSETDNTNETEDNEIKNEEDFSYTIVTSEQWKNTRHKDIAQFIGLSKQMPNSENDDKISEMLNTAYKLNRNNLEPISEMEIAINFLKSDQNKVAWISLIIAFFLDIASFLIGIILFFFKSENKEKSSTENS